MSRRPYETVLPLCARLHLDPVVDYGVGEEKKLVKAVTAQTGIALIAWEYKTFRQLFPMLLSGDSDVPL